VTARAALFAPARDPAVGLLRSIGQLPENVTWTTFHDDGENDGRRIDRRQAAAPP
jgi:hypothetical protein